MMKSKFVLVTIAVLLSASSIWAQATRKPSAMRASKEDLQQTATSEIKSLSKIQSQAEFDDLARVYHQGTSYALPHTMFLIDRQDNDKIYYINSKKYRFHKDFANAAYLSLERGEAFTNSNYLNPNRRFVLGTLAWQTPIQKWTFEFWEGDTISADLIKTTYDTINNSFFAPVAFKPNSNKQDENSAKLNIARISADEINKGQEYLPLNEAKAVGRIHVIDKLDDTVEIGYNEILVLKEVPISLPPVRGIIVAKPSTPLSHINLLAKGWNIPNAYVKNADKLFKDFDTYWVVLETKGDKYEIKRATNDNLKEPPPIPDDIKTPPADLTKTRLLPLALMRKKDSAAYGSKAANLGEIVHFKQLGFTVPDGFSIPYIYYKQFMEANNFDNKVADLLDDNDFVHNPRSRRQKLKEFRAQIQSGKFDDKLRAQILRQWKTQLAGKPVFIRSSSNAEDLPNFSGAGLYDSVKNVTADDKIIEAVKTVWASVWNFEAYEARERNFVDHTKTYMSAFVQTGVDMDNGGVMITRDPFDQNNKNAVYISAVFGHNLQVTAGDADLKKAVIPEQILFTPKSNSVQVLTRSNQDTIFKFAKSGGVEETKISTTRQVLTDALTRQLVTTANQIKRIFGNNEQDIEWGILKNRIYIVQSRPYIDKSKMITYNVGK